MTTTDLGTGTTRATDLTRDQLVALHPYVIDIPDGKLAEGPSTPPTTVSDFKTTEADVDAIFDTYLPSFLARRGLCLVALRAYEAALVVDVPVRKSKHAHVPFAVEGNVGHARRILEVGPYAIERAGQVGR